MLPLLSVMEYLTGQNLTNAGLAEIEKLTIIYLSCYLMRRFDATLVKIETNKFLTIMVTIMLNKVQYSLLRVARLRNQNCVI